MAARHRSRTRLVLDILRALRDEPEAAVNRLLLVANLSYARLKANVDEAVAKGWVEEIRASDRRTWRLTPQGLSVLAELEKIDDRMEDFGLGF